MQAHASLIIYTSLTEDVECPIRYGTWLHRSRLALHHLSTIANDSLFRWKSRFSPEDVLVSQRWIDPLESMKLLLQGCPICRQTRRDCRYR